MNLRAAKIAARIVEKTVVRIGMQIVAKTVSTIAAARAMLIERTTKGTPGTDSRATSKIATHDRH
jgi:hypothetical protein